MHSMPDHSMMSSPIDIKFITIQPRLQSCDKIPAKRTGVKVSVSLEHLICVVPELNDLPYFETKTDANIQLIVN